jgi:hypothetical protein
LKEVLPHVPVRVDDVCFKGKSQLAGMKDHTLPSTSFKQLSASKENPNSGIERKGTVQIHGYCSVEASKENPN